MELREGNVFTSVCLSTGGGVGISGLMAFPGKWCGYGGGGGGWEVAMARGSTHHTYGQQANGKHPAGMISFSYQILDIAISNFRLERAVSFPSFSVVNGT